MRPRDREYGQAGRMVGAFDEWQPGDDLRRRLALERRPPTTGASHGGRRHEPEIAPRSGDGCHHTGRTQVADEWHREAEMEASGITHRGVARREIGMHR